MTANNIPVISTSCHVHYATSSIDEVVSSLKPRKKRTMLKGASAHSGATHTCARLTQVLRLKIHVPDSSPAPSSQSPFSQHTDSRSTTHLNEPTSTEENKNLTRQLDNFLTNLHRSALHVSHATPPTVLLTFRYQLAPLRHSHTLSFING